MENDLKLNITGCRGIPCQHGGFEMFADHLSEYLVKKNWDVTVYCQESGSGAIFESTYKGIRLVHVPSLLEGTLGSMVFDLRSILHVSTKQELVLVLGYNTAILHTYLALKKITHIVNMDGIEWKRQKWGWLAKAWLWINEICALKLSTVLVADHPEIHGHLNRFSWINPKIATIPYGAVQGTHCESSVNPGDRDIFNQKYILVVARPEPENSIHTIVEGFERANLLDTKLVIVGNYSESNSYHKLVKNLAGPNTIFAGAIYEKARLRNFRMNACCYIHGHTVGGTNPSLVEALGCGNFVIAHDNKYNKWVIGDLGKYFLDSDQLAICLQDHFMNDEQMTNSNDILDYFRGKFGLDRVNERYRQILSAAARAEDSNNSFYNNSWE